MESEEFYVLNSDRGSQNVRLSPDGLRGQQEDGTSERVHLINGKYDEIQFPKVFRQVAGRIWTDLLHTDMVGLYLISEDLIRCLNEEKLDGWKTFPVEVYSSSGELKPGYQGFSVTGKCGKPDFSKAVSIEKSLVKGGKVSLFYRGFPIDIDEWDKSSIFSPSGTTFKLVTKEAYDRLIVHSPSGIEWIAASDYEIAARHVNF